MQTARLWQHELGFEVLDKKKGVYIDGHERDDVIQHRHKFLRQLIGGGFLTPECAPNIETSLRKAEISISLSNKVGHHGARTSALWPDYLATYTKCFEQLLTT